MDHELWAELSAAISLIDRDFFDNSDYLHPTSLIVRCYCWAVLNDKPTTNWACDPRHWSKPMRPLLLPGQSTLSRRPNSPEFEEFMKRLERRLAHLPKEAGSKLFKRLDGHPLAVAAHSKDREATWGRGAGQKSKGYKLHALWSAAWAMPSRWRLAPLDKSEPEMARRMLRNLQDDPGYIVADKNYDSNKLFDQAGKVNNQLLCPRRYGPKKGLGHHRHSPFRLRSRDLLETPTAQLSGFGPALMKQRNQIERDFGNAASFSAGLHGLPPWVRRYARVRRWVWAKLLINADRIRINYRKSTMRA